jgi:hypothetical protein
MRSMQVTQVVALAGAAVFGPMIVSCSGSMAEPPPAGLTFKQIDLIDDMESDNPSAYILDRGGRNGQWFGFADTTVGGTMGTWLPNGTGVQVGDGHPIPMLPLDSPHPLYEGEPESKQGLHFKASGFKLWGAGWEATLHSTSPGPTEAPDTYPQGGTATYDVSPYTGVTFWAKTGGPSATNLKVSFPDIDTQPPPKNIVDPAVPEVPHQRERTNDEKICVDDAKAPLTRQCWDDFAKTITLSTEWRQFVVPFSELAQGGYGYKPPLGFDPKTVFVIKFAVPQNLPFDIWMDDIAFYVK